MDENAIGERVLGCAIKVHRALGPGLLESVYETCLALEFDRSGLPFQKQLWLPIEYAGQTIEEAYRLDLVVHSKVVIEVKALERIAEVHKAQLLSYLRLGGYRLGYVLNFHAPRLADGVCRLVNDPTYSVASVSTQRSPC